MNLKNKILLTEKLYYLYSSGKPVMESLDSLIVKEKNRSIKNILIEIYASIKSGDSLGEAMSEFEDDFGEVFCRLILAGEQSGKLEEVLKELTSLFSAEQILRLKIIGALTFPIIALFATIVGFVLIFIIFFALIVNFLNTFNQKPPEFIQFIMNLQAFCLLPSNILIAFISLLFLILILYIFLNIGIFDNIRGRLFLWIPGLGHLNKLQNFYSYFFTYKICYDAGLTLAEASELAINSLNNVYLESKLVNISSCIHEGMAVSSSLRKTSVFDRDIVDIIDTGEESGKLDLAFDKITKIIDTRINITIGLIIAAIKPLGFFIGLIFVISIIIFIGAVLFSIMSPLLEKLNSTLGH